MGLIIKDKLPMFKVGYPTVSDKYNVAGGILTGSYSVNFGDPVKEGSQPGYFVKASSVSAATDIKGFVVATNVKMPNDWPGTTVAVNPGEAFNLLVSGFMAIQLADSAVAADIVPNSAVRVNQTGGITTSTVTTNTYELPGVVFTGYFENVGTVASPSYVAEIYVK